MDDDIRDFLDRVEQKRLYEQQKKRKNKILEKQKSRQKRKSLRNVAQTGAELSIGKKNNADSELSQLADNGRDYSTEPKFVPRQRTTKEQKKFDWEHRLHFISVPMGGQNKKR